MEKVSIIIVNFNGKKWLSDCLKSLSNQTYNNIETILVDNASKDGSVVFVKKEFPKINIIKNKENLGFAEGNNVGLKKAAGDYILLLNNDTWVPKDFVEQFVIAFEKFPNVSILQSKIVWMNEQHKIDSCGSYWTDTSFLYYIGDGKNAELKKYNKPFPLFSVKGASMLIKKEVIVKIGLFDADFWNYYEETDFCHRAWIAGYEVWYWPKAVCYHAIGGTSLTLPNDHIQFHNYKNKLMSFIKNFETESLVIIIPVFIFFNIVISLLWLMEGKLKHFLSLYKAIIWNVSNLSNNIEKRKIVQNNRRNSDKKIFKLVKHNPKLNYFYLLFRSKLEFYKDPLL